MPNRFLPGLILLATFELTSALVAAEPAVASRMHPSDLAIGGVAAGMSETQVQKLLGSPEGVPDRKEVEPKSQFKILRFSDSQVLVMLFQGKVMTVRSRDQRLATARGLKLHDPESKVIELYGPPSSRHEGSEPYLEYQVGPEGSTLTVWVKDGAVAILQFVVPPRAGS